MLGIWENIFCNGYIGVIDVGYGFLPCHTVQRCCAIDRNNRKMGTGEFFMTVEQFPVGIMA